VLERQESEGSIHLTVRISPANLARYGLLS